MARGNQMVRQWSILQRLRGCRYSRRQLAQEFGVSLKTIMRDIDALSMFPITEEYEGIDVFYQLLDGSYTPGVWFTPDELNALLLASGTILPTLDKTPYKQAFESLVQKVERTQKGYTYRHHQRLPEVFQVYPSSRRTQRTIEEPLLNQLLTAALDTRKLEMTYFTVYRQTLTQRIIEPFVIYQSPHGFRLIAYCHKRNDIRFFSINQIRNVRVLEETFDLEARRFDLNEFLLTSFDDMVQKPIVDVLLHIKNPTAYRVRDRNFHPTQRIRDVEDGIELSFRSGGIPAIAARVLAMGPDCHAISPPALRDFIKKRIQQLAALYEPT